MRNGRVPLRVAVVNAVYPPEPVVSAQMGRDLAQHFADSGSGVTVFCPYPTRPCWADYANFRPSSACRLSIRSVTTCVAWVGHVFQFSYHCL